MRRGTGSAQRQHKQRRLHQSRLSRAVVAQSARVWAGNGGLRACGAGTLAANLVRRLHSHARRALRTARRPIRVWVNAVCQQVVTRKPLNTRMGKGKGSRKGVAARVFAGARLLLCEVPRYTALRRLRRWLQVRSALRVGLVRPVWAHATWLRRHLQRRPGFARRYVSKVVTMFQSPARRRLTARRPWVALLGRSLLRWHWDSSAGLPACLPYDATDARQARRVKRRRRALAPALGILLTPRVWRKRRRYWSGYWPALATEHAAVRRVRLSLRQRARYALTGR